VVVRFVHIHRIVDHHCLNFLFIITLSLLANIRYAQILVTHNIVGRTRQGALCATAPCLVAALEKMFNLKRFGR
jgi:hypothetical protein